MFSIRVLSALMGACVIILAGCGGSEGDNAGTTATSTPERLAVVTSIAPTTSAASTESATVSREQVVIEQKVATESGADISALRPRRLGNVPVPTQIRLSPLAVEASTSQKSSNTKASSGDDRQAPVKIGTGRKVADTANTQKVGSILAWTPTSGGDAKIAAMRFSSPGARGVRIGLKVESLPMGAQVRFYSDGAEKAYEVSAQEILATIQRNLDAGDSSDAARTFWSPNLGGESITIEVEIPASSSSDSVKISVPALSHVAVDIDKVESTTKAAGVCTLDVSCSSEYEQLGKSVALMEFTESDGNDYICTATLMNDRVSSGIPYILSADHCISTQSVASTLITYWNYKSASCGSTQVDSRVTTSTRMGASLLHASADTDTSFMRLNGLPPVGAIYAGSSPFGLSANESIHGVSQPTGDFQKYTRGNYIGTAICGSTTCTNSNASNANHLRVSWWQGVTEKGSSGSGLFTKLNGRNYLVGQLTGGNSSCTNRSGSDFYGRFDKAYNAALYQWLGVISASTRQPIYRLYNRGTGTHFYTPNAAERDVAVEKLGVYSYEGIAFYAYGAPGVANDTVYRFYNTRNGVHFYTINPGERDNVIRTLPWLTYEGGIWYAGAASTPQSSPMFRFLNRSTGVHFYTINAAERDMVIATAPNFNYEGIAYHAWLAP